jgi:pyoverdine/dityrosine biosynthesis protein Dit1
MIKRNEALVNLLKSCYSKHIRLSIHQHVNNGEKFTIGLFRENTGQADTQSLLRTAWHNVLVITPDGHKILLPHKKVYLQSDYLPIMYKDQIWCYVQLP